MSSDLEELRRRRSEQEDALRQQKMYEKERKKAQKGIIKASRKSMRSKARAAAKEAYPDSKLVLVYNGKPIAVREVERPAQGARSAPSQARRLPDGPYRSVRSMNAEPVTGIPMAGRPVVRNVGCYGGMCEADVGSVRGTPVRRKAPAKKKPAASANKRVSTQTTKKAPAKKSSSKTTARKSTAKAAPKKCGTRR